MTTKVRCFCDSCGTEMPASKLRPVFTVAPVLAVTGWASLGQQLEDWRYVKLGDACEPCMTHLIRALAQSPREPEPDVVDRILEGMDL